MPPENMLTETAFVIPGTKTKVPRWAVLAIVGALILILLLAKRQGATVAEETPEEEEESQDVAGMDWQAFLDALLAELDQVQGDVETPGTPPYTDDYISEPPVSDWSLPDVFKLPLETKTAPKDTSPVPGGDGGDDGGDKGPSKTPDPLPKPEPKKEPDGKPSPKVVVMSAPRRV